ncbi:hypothetical protein MTO96_033863 [Rhipicephalus appendiculatus]
MFSTKSFPGYTCISDLEQAGKFLKYIEPEAHEDDVIIMSNTSGTTGIPKIMEVQQQRFLRQMCCRDCSKSLKLQRLPARPSRQSRNFAPKEFSSPERIAAEVVSVFAPDDLRDCYGMTEVSGFLAVPPKGELPQGNVGFPVCGTKMKVSFHFTSGITGLDDSF